MCFSFGLQVVPCLAELPRFSRESVLRSVLCMYVVGQLCGLCVLAVRSKVFVHADQGTFFVVSAACGVRGASVGIDLSPVQ